MKTLAIDTETTGSYFHLGCRPFMITMADEDGLLYKREWDVNPYTREVDLTSREAKQNLQEAWEIILSYEGWVFHNAIFDLTAMEYLFSPGEMRRARRKRVIHDTMLMAHCHNSLDRLGLKGLALQYLNYPETDEQILKQAVNRARRLAKKQGFAIAEPDHPHLTPLKKEKGNCDFWLPKALIIHGDLEDEDREYFEPVCGNYAIGDVERTIMLFMFFSTILKGRGDFQYYEQNARCLIPILEMQKEGLPLNRKTIVQVVHELDQHREELVSGLKRASRCKDLNPRSGDQVRHALYEKLGVEATSFTKAGKESTDKEALKDLLEHAELTKVQEVFIKRLLSYRKLTTASTYLESYNRFEVDGKLYTNFNPTGTTTTRCSSQNPNAQNISKQENDEDMLDLSVSVNLRGAFGPPKGHLWVCIDYAQLQLRIFAHACEDEYLINAFSEGLDIHDTVARKVFSTDDPSGLQRRAAKAINFGIIFGAGKRKIERMSGVEGSYDEFKRQFPLVDRYLRRTEQQAKKMGYIRTLGGYPLRVPRATAYKACNYIVQGTEGEMVKDAITVTSTYCTSPNVFVKPIMTIHDEIIFQTKKPCDTSTFVKKYYHQAEQIMNLMNSSGDKFHVDTEVDMKIVDKVWSSSSSVTAASME